MTWSGSLQEQALFLATLICGDLEMVQCATISSEKKSSAAERMTWHRPVVCFFGLEGKVCFPLEERQW